MRRVRVGALLAAASISVAAGSEPPPPGELAHTALHLRLRAEESGRYPERLDELPAFLATARGDLPGVEYSSRGPAGASLRLVPATDESDPPPSAEMPPAVRQRHELVTALRAWELPGLLLPEDAEGVE